MTSSPISANDGRSGSTSVVAAERGVVDGRLVGPIAVKHSHGHIDEVLVGDAVDPLVAPYEPGTVLTPGLIDVQVNGGRGVDLAAADSSGWATVSDHLVTHGVTAFCPTAITAPIGELVAFVQQTGTMRTELATRATAQPLGAHIEGPFLSPAKAGAHPTQHLARPSTQACDQLLDAGVDGALAMLTLAPELPGCLELIELLSSRGVAVAIGHTDASAPATSAAVDAGARWVTHLFNAQRSLHHRDPGVIGHALTDPRLTCGLIADGHHVADEVVQLAFAAAGDRLALVSDAVSAAGMPAGTYRLGAVTAHLSGDGPPVTGDGTLAGSSLSLDEAVRHVMSLGVEPAAAVAAATSVPASGLGRDDIGQLRPGARADFVLWSSAWGVASVWVAGTLAHNATR